MNPGYVSLVLYVILMILAATGWKDILFRGVSRTSILLFFVGWIPFGWLQLPLNERISVNGAVLFLLLFIIAATRVIPGAMGRFNVWCIGLLLGVFHFLMRELNGWSLLFDYGGLFFHSALVLAMLTIMLGRHPVWQFTALSVGLLSGELLHLWQLRDTAEVLVLGGPAFNDQWWLVLFLTRAASIFLEVLIRGTWALLRIRSERRKEWRE